jgi:hypothetical protein
MVASEKLKLRRIKKTDATSRIILIKSMIVYYGKPYFFKNIEIKSIFF